ncbi:hypothetical protein QVD17_25603 [Tagetes erecta]|uniref:Uncharacterized protein n=1 Tax=Tagetes erecta TaxID=13708 RepID=A0AAD8KJE3_TARER|nr:hypothetical protein QVD17_25603 [Tagetes erecta]
MWVGMWLDNDGRINLGLFQNVLVLHLGDRHSRNSVVVGAIGVDLWCQWVLFEVGFGVCLRVGLGEVFGVNGVVEEGRLGAVLGFDQYCFSSVDGGSWHNSGVEHVAEALNRVGRSKARIDVGSA